MFYAGNAENVLPEQEIDRLDQDYLVGFLGALLNVMERNPGDRLKVLTTYKMYKALGRAGLRNPNHSQGEVDALATLAIYYKKAQAK